MTWIRGETRLDRRRSAHQRGDGDAPRYALARKHLGDDPVVAVIFTHSHVDHFGGVKAVLPERLGRRRAHRDRARALRRGGDQRERAGRHRDGPARAPSSSARRCRSGRAATSTPVSASSRSPAPPASRRRPTSSTTRRRRWRSTACASCSSTRRTPRRPPSSPSTCPTQQGLVRRRDREPHDAQPLHAARRQGARRAQVERLHRRRDPALRRHRGRLHEPHLADLRARARASRS